MELRDISLIERIRIFENEMYEFSKRLTFHRLRRIDLGCEFCFDKNEKIDYLTKTIKEIGESLKTAYVQSIFLQFDTIDIQKTNCGIKKKIETNVQNKLEYLFVGNEDKEMFYSFQLLSLFLLYEDRLLYHFLMDRLNTITKAPLLLKANNRKTIINLKKGAKIDLIRVIVAMYDNGFFEDETKQKVDLINVMKTLGDVLGVDLSDYDNSLSTGFLSKIETNLKVFNDLKQAIQKRYNKRLEK